MPKPTGRKKPAARSGTVEPRPSAPAPTRDRGGLPGLAAVFVVALAARLAALSALGRLVLFRTPQLDSLEYLRWAQSIAAGESRWPLLPTHAPGYPYFLGTLLALFDGSLTAARFIQALLGAVLCVVVALLGRRLYGPRAGLVAGLLLALYGPLIYVELSLLAEGTFLLCLVLALAALLSPWRSSHPIPAAAVTGLFLGLAALTRATALALLPFFLLLLLLRRGGGSRGPAGVAQATGSVGGGEGGAHTKEPSSAGPAHGWAGAFVMVAVTLLLVIPATVKVSRVAGSFVPLQAFGGLNLYMGNDPAGTGTPGARLGGDWDHLQAEPLRLGLNAAEQERYFTRKAREVITGDPLGWLAVLGKKALWLIQDDEIRDSHSFHFFAAEAPLLRWLPGWGLLFPLAVCGLWIAARKRSLPPLLAVYLLVMAASCVLIVVASRYRLPLVPVLALFAGLAAVTLWDAARQRRTRDFSLLAGIAVAAWLAGHLWNHEPSRDFTEEWVMSGQSLENEGDLAAAESAYRRALERSPESALAWNGVGKVRVKQGDLAGAEEAFTTATRLDPAYSRSYYNLGIAYRAAGNVERAVAAFRRAVELAPDHVAAMTELGTLLLARGEVMEADTLLRKVVAMDPNNAAANLGLARLEGAAQRPESGVPFAERAVAGAPDDPEAWITLSMLALEAKNAAAAERAVRRLEELMGTDAPGVVLQRATLARLQGRPADADRELRALLQRDPRIEPAARLLLLNAAEQGRRAEAEAFLRELWQ
ncbi:MAG TPA: tetratricopeptide repeat protein [Thermoanaerobaculia bacterium]|nr:tetratricopeptide repeat protein [Thermoanaerobaculia bacterium]